MSTKSIQSTKNTQNKKQLKDNSTQYPKVIYNCNDEEVPFESLKEIQDYMIDMDTEEPFEVGIYEFKGIKKFQLVKETSFEEIK